MKKALLWISLCLLSACTPTEEQTPTPVTTDCCAAIDCSQESVGACEESVCDSTACECSTVARSNENLRLSNKVPAAQCHKIRFGALQGAKLRNKLISKHFHLC